MNDDGFKIPTRISRNLTPMLGEDRFFNVVIEYPDWLIEYPD